MGQAVKGLFLNWDISKRDIWEDNKQSNKFKEVLQLQDIYKSNVTQI